MGISELIAKAKEMMGSAGEGFDISQLSEDVPGADQLTEKLGPLSDILKDSSKE